MSELYPNDALARQFLPAVFEQVVQISPWYTVEYAKSLDKGLISLSRKIRVSKSESKVIKVAERAESSTSTTVKRGIKERQKTSGSVAADESHEMTSTSTYRRAEPSNISTKRSGTSSSAHTSVEVSTSATGDTPASTSTRGQSRSRLRGTTPSAYATTLPGDPRPESKYFALPFSVTHSLPNSTLLTAFPLLLNGFLFPSQV